MFNFFTKRKEKEIKEANDLKEKKMRLEKQKKENQENEQRDKDFYRINVKKSGQLDVKEIEVSNEEMLLKNKVVDLTDEGELEEFYLSGCFYTSADKITVKLRLKIWYNHLNEYKDLLEKANNKKFDMDYIQTGTLIFGKENGCIYQELGLHQGWMLLGECVDFYYDPEEGNCILTFETPINGRMYEVR